MAEVRPSLLDFANKEAFGCDDYEPRGEIVQEHIINPEDGIVTVVAKSQRLADRVLDGKSVAVALGDIKVKRREEQEIKNLTLKEKHKWQLWKNAKGELPPMQWQAEQEVQQDGGDQKDEQQQQGLGKRKNGSIRDGGQSDQRRRVKKRSGEESSQVTVLEIEALAEIYHLPLEMRSRVVEADVRYFRRTYAPLKPLLSAMAKIVQARSEATHSTMDKKMEEECREIEIHSTEKAIYLAEKQAKWILDETAKMCESVHESVSILRGRLSALQEQQGDWEDEEEDYESAVSSTVASPASGRGADNQDQVEQDEAMEGEAAIAELSNHEILHTSSPPRFRAEEQQLNPEQGGHRIEESSPAREQPVTVQKSGLQDETMADVSPPRHEDNMTGDNDSRIGEGMEERHDASFEGEHHEEAEEDKCEEVAMIRNESMQGEAVRVQAKVWEPREGEQEDVRYHHWEDGQPFEEPHQGEEQEVDTALVQKQPSPPVIPAGDDLPVDRRVVEQQPIAPMGPPMGPLIVRPSTWFEAQGRFKPSMTSHYWPKRQDAARSSSTIEAAHISSSAPELSQAPSNQGAEALFSTSAAKSFFHTLS